MPDPADERDILKREPQEGRDPSPGEDPATLRLLREEASFDKRRVETGRVRVRVVTREEDETIEVPLMREHVEIERVPIGRAVEAIPPRRQEGDVTIVPVVEEVIVMRRQLVLKEELHLRLARTTEQHRERVTLRRQEAVVERLPAEQLSTEQKSE